MSDIVQPIDAFFQEILCLPTSALPPMAPLAANCSALSIAIGSGAVAVIGKPLVSRLDEMIC